MRDNARYRSTARRTVFASVAAVVMCAFVLGGCASLSSNGANDPESTPNEAAPGKATPQECADQLIGEWSSDETGSPSLTFNADGTVVGTDGCNGISSTFTTTAVSAEIARFVSTLRACQGVDGWLRGVHTVTLDFDEPGSSSSTTQASTLRVHDAAGAEIGQLLRKN